MPPGKVCDFFGFQYIGYTDAAGKGHNPMFLNRAAGNVLHILNEEQKQKLLDLALGQVLRKLDELGIANNTYVIFTTDHGSPGRNPPLAGGKGTVSEGGLRAPFILRGPSIQAGICSHVRAVGEDLFPTIAALAPVSEPLPRGIEGGSLVFVLTNAGKGTVQRPREEFVVHFLHYDKDAVGPASAIYLGDLKLFDIPKDPGERRDLIYEWGEEIRRKRWL
jgi:arylsulfatase A